MTKNEKTILIGVTGGIAAYKTCELIRLLRTQNYQVYVIMTKNAMQFITPLTFKILTDNPVFYDTFSESENINMPHISLSKLADLFLISPASANIIAKISHGIADDLVSTLCLSYTGKILIAPAMNTAMYDNPIFQKNLDILGHFPEKYRIIEPDSGPLACGDEGKGRLAENSRILSIIQDEFKANKK